MILRDRLKELAGFIDADFEHRDGLWSVGLVEDPDHGWYLIGKTGRACRSALAFPVGCSITFLAFINQRQRWWAIPPFPWNSRGRIGGGDDGNEAPRLG